MDLRCWIDDELALVGDRVTTQVLDLVPIERRAESNDGGSSITVLLWHVARHQDVAVVVVGGTDDVEALDEFGA